MKPRRAWTWIIFWAGVCIVVGALSWASYSVYQLEERNAEVKANAQRQELIRLALWRIDSRIAPIIALEASRPYTEYEQLQISPDELFRNAGFDSSGTPGFTRQSQSFVKQYFQYDNEGEQDDQITLSGSAGGGRANPDSPIASSTLTDSTRGNIAAAEPSSQVVAADEDLRRQQSDYDFKARKAVADIAAQNVEVVPKDDRADERKKTRAREESEVAEDGIDEAANESAFDYGYEENAAPSRTVESVITNSVGAQVGGLTPQWMIGEDGSSQLVLVRTVTVGGQSFTQGVWLDWAALNDDLIAAVSDIMPSSLIHPAAQSTNLQAYPLATIPAVFIPGGAIALPAQTLTPAMIAMMVTWIAIIVAIASIGFVLRAAIKLSERRGRFVTAVTHELRTPLTTFRLYSQMLADGMVPDETVREQYLTILKRESERLTGIVENVLEYARLSRRRSTKDSAAGVQSLTPDALLVRFRPALSRRAEQSNMDLVTSIDLIGFENRTLTVDPQAVERIMMNLIENACKYASMPEDLDASKAEEFDTRIHLDATISDGMLGLLIADHGPGIDPSERARIFGEFQRGVRRKILNRSGLGLGLALSRGLAREMGGDLQLVSQRGHGAEFMLTIPLDDAIRVP